MFFNVTLRNQYGNTEIRRKSETTIAAAFGATFEPVESNTLQRLKIANGVSVHNITEGSVRQAGIKNGFIITKIDKKRVNTPDEVAEISETLSFIFI